MDDAERELADRQRFARRLEAFSDIVFGFALAQCAVALDVPKTVAELGTKLGDLFFFTVTFALVGAFWLMHYRVFHYVFAARRLDVVLNFGLLATVALLPYALRLWTTFKDTVPGSMAYAAALGFGFTFLAALEWRGLREPEPLHPLTPKAAGMMQKAARRHGISAVVFLISFGLFPFFGLNARIVWGAIAPAMLLVRLFERSRAAAPGTPAAAAES